MFLSIFLRFLPTLITWALYFLGHQYPGFFPATIVPGADVASLVTVANLVPSPLKVKSEPASFERK